MLPSIQKEAVLERVDRSVRRSGRKLSDITIVAVTKALPVTYMEAAWEEGFTVMGESRVQEAEEKFPEFSHTQEAELHLIGHLQKNKARKAVELFDVIESVDSVKLAERISRIATLQDIQQRIFMQVNTGKDPAKYGLMPEDALDAARQITRLPGVILEGLMVVAPMTKDEKRLRSVFAGTRELKETIRKSVNPLCRFLSMGMSGDFPFAVEEGATHIRVGTVLFGERPK